MTYIISDIHGEYELFLQLMGKIDFSDGDELYILGDMIDKGSQSIRLLRAIMGKQNIHCIIGNHEYDFLKYYWAHLEQNPTDFDAFLAKLQGYFPQDTDRITWEMIDWLEALPFYVETSDFIGVHAGIPIVDGRLMARGEVVPEQFVYDRVFKNRTDISAEEKCVFFGHTPVRSLTGADEMILSLKEGRNGTHISDYRKVHLDTGVYLSDVLGCFCVEECKAYYVRRLFKG